LTEYVIYHYHLFQLMLHIHSLCTLNYTKHQITGKHTKSFQLDVGINNAQLLYRFSCYHKENLADLIVQNIGPENLKPQFSTEPAPSPKNGVVESREYLQNQIFCSCISFMVWFEAISNSLDSNEKFSSLLSGFGGLRVACCL